MRLDHRDGTRDSIRRARQGPVHPGRCEQVLDLLFIVERYLIIILSIVWMLFVGKLFAVHVQRLCRRQRHGLILGVWGFESVSKEI